MGKIVPFQMPLAMAEHPDRASYQRRLDAARTAPELRAVAEEMLRDYDAALDRERGRKFAEWVEASHHARELTRILLGPTDGP